MLVYSVTASGSLKTLCCGDKIYKCKASNAEVANAFSLYFLSLDDSTYFILSSSSSSKIFCSKVITFEKFLVLNTVQKILWNNLYHIHLEKLKYS